MPKTGKKQDAVLTIRLYSAQLDSIQMGAIVAKKAVSAFVRDCAIEECKRLESASLPVSNPSPDALQNVPEEKKAVRIHSEPVSKRTRSVSSKKYTPKVSLSQTEKELFALIDRQIAGKTEHELGCICYSCASLRTMMRPKRK